MKKLLTKTVCLILSTVAVLTGALGCGKTGKYGDNYKAENAVVDKNYIYGMCNLYGEENIGVDLDEDTVIDAYSSLIDNLGVNTVRIWMHFSYVMNRTSPDRLSKTNCTAFHTMIEKHIEDGMKVIGMNHHNYYLDENDRYSIGSGIVPNPNVGKGIDYKKFLEDYETSWYTLAKEFSEITIWEIGNECNSDTFLHGFDNQKYSLTEKAKIFADMMYYGSKGIHRANPDNLTVIGGLTMKDASAFLTAIYDYIYSGDAPSKYADDYFQIAAWHPYLHQFSESRFKSMNDELYQIVKTREGKDKKVYLTEMGWNSNDTPKNNISGYMTKAYAVIKDQLSYVETGCYFRMFDVLDSDWGSESEKVYGLFEDPVSLGSGEYSKQDETYAKPKDLATAYQLMAGGQGSLTLLQELLDGNS